MKNFFFENFDFLSTLFSKTVLNLCWLSFFNIENEKISKSNGSEC